MITKEQIDEYFNNTPPEVIKATWEKAKEMYPDNVAGITVSQLVDSQEYYQEVQELFNRIIDKKKELLGLENKFKKIHGHQPQCDSCEQLGRRLHPCPYKEDIYGDSTTLCNCCSSCQDECFSEI